MYIHMLEVAPEDLHCPMSFGAIRPLLYHESWRGKIPPTPRRCWDRQPSHQKLVDHLQTRLPYHYENMGVLASSTWTEPLTMSRHSLDYDIVFTLTLCFGCCCSIWWWHSFLCKTSITTQFNYHIKPGFCISVRAHMYSWSCSAIRGCVLTSWINAHGGLFVGQKAAAAAGAHM